MENIWPIEINIILFLQSLGLWLKPIFSAITFLGSEEFYMVVMPALYWCLSTALGFRIGLILLLSGTFNTIFKWLGASPRPYWVDTRVSAMSSETGFGLPSGHSMNSASIWGLMGFKIGKSWSIIGALVIIFLIGISRLYLGVHFVSDVLAGWLLGGLLLFAFLKLDKPISKWLSGLSLTSQVLLSVGSSLLIIVLSLATVLLRQNWTVPEMWLTNALAAGAEAPNPLAINGIFTSAGTWLGMALGYTLLRHFQGGFNTDGTIWQLIMRYAVGLVGVLFLWKGLGAFLPTEPDALASILRYLRYALVGLWIAWWAPVVFIKLKLAKPV